MDLQSLVHGMADAPAIEISGIATDSRLVGPGYVFFACSGEQSHGLDFIDQAIAAGAKAIVHDASSRTPPSGDAAVPMISLPGLQQHIGEIANRWFDTPSAALRVTAVTGTNGKTTVASMLAQCLQILGHRAGYIGTLGQGIGKYASATGLTSPACIELHEALAGFRDRNATHAAIEVSSHALTQGRTDGVQFDAAIFTNLSRDHLDYHGDMSSYFDSKARLFTDNELQHRIINIDSDYGRQLAERCDDNVVLVSTQLEPETQGAQFVYARAVNSDYTGSQINVVSSWGEANFELQLPGDFNVENAALVLALLLRQDVPISDAASALSRIHAPPGRMQLVEYASDLNLPSVFVDFAHTPDGLEKALRAIGRFRKGDTWCVFGCGGDRDRGKRRQMGEVASQLSNHLVLTSDNPRSENPLAIIDEIMAGTDGKATVVEDRAAAIAYAIRECSDSAVILVAGKGHESFQIIGDESIPFSDYEVALANLQARNKRGAGS
jgi:UDP-N-acetylmuramoyl-L-alanyl-D-glutamate--2,6-diaminopimelate ligase